VFECAWCVCVYVCDVCVSLFVYVNVCDICVVCMYMNIGVF